MNNIYIKNSKSLHKILNKLRNEGKKIVYTQGVWDLIHEGHARYLAKAKELGDVLFVGVDSDKLTKKRKGPTRPIVPEKERIEMLTHLKSVNYIIVKDLKHGISYPINEIKPDFMVISSSTKDFTKKDADAYKDICGKIVLFEPQSTTTTSARVRTLTIDGATGLSNELRKFVEEFIKKLKD